MDWWNQKIIYNIYNGRFTRGLQQLLPFHAESNFQIGLKYIKTVPLGNREV
jgi:hypothetical protein